MQAPSTSQAPPNTCQPNNTTSPDVDVSRPDLLPPTSSTSTSRPVRKVSRSYAIQDSHIAYTDEVSAKPSRRVRRKCFKCHTIDASAWRRSSLTPSKVLCNRCGLFERTRPMGSPRKTGPVVRAHQPKQHHDTSPQPPSRAAQADAAAGLTHQKKKQKQQHWVYGDPEMQAAGPSTVAGESSQQSPQQTSRRITPWTMEAGAHAAPEGQASGSTQSTPRKEQGEATDRASD